MSLLDFLPKKDLPTRVSKSKPRVQIPQDNFINPYWFKNFIIGKLNSDFSVLKLTRTSKNFTTRKYPQHTQISREVIIDLVYRKKTRKILIEIDKEIKYWTTPRTWLSRGIKDKLTPEQEDQLFLSLKLIHEVKS